MNRHLGIETLCVGSKASACFEPFQKSENYQEVNSECPQNFGNGDNYMMK